MNELILTFNEEEYLVLAKMVDIAQWIICVNGVYQDFDIVNKIANDIYKKGFYELPETKSFREMGEMNDIPYGISVEMAEETSALTDLAEIQAMEEHLPYSLAARDFREMYGELKDEVILMDAKLLGELKAIQKKYIDEFAKYGVTHLRLEEPKNLAN